MAPSQAGWLRGGRLAFLLSLAVHAALGLGAVTLSSRPRAKGSPGSPLLDAVTVATDEDAPLSIVRGQAIAPKRPANKTPLRKRIRRPALPNSPPPIVASPTSVLPPPVPVAMNTNPAGPGPAISGLSGSGANAGGRDHGIPGGTTAFFNVATDCQTIVYVIDRSASMGPVHGGVSGLDIARRELQASLAALPATARFQVIVYNQSTEILCIDGTLGLAQATEDHKRVAERLLDAMTAEGCTNHGPALVRALGLRPDVIFFLTDADDLTAEQVTRATQINAAQNGGRTVIHTIELNTANRGRADMPLQVLARSNHGIYRAVSLEE